MMLVNVEHFWWPRSATTITVIVASLLLGACSKPSECSRVTSTVAELFGDSITEASKYEPPEIQATVKSYAIAVHGAMESSYDSERKTRECFGNLVITPPEALRGIAGSWLKNAPEIQTALFRGQIIKHVNEEVAAGTIPSNLEEAEKRIRAAADKINTTAGMGLLFGNVFSLSKGQSDTETLNKVLEDIDKLNFLTRLEKLQYSLAVMNRPRLPSIISNDVKEVFGFTKPMTAEGLLNYKTSYTVKLNSEGESIISASIPSMKSPIALARVHSDVIAYRTAIQPIATARSSTPAEPLPAPASTVPQQEATIAAPVPPPIPLAPSQPSNLQQLASNCSGVDACISIMLQAANQRDSESIKAAAALISEMPKSQRGDRKAARALNSQALDEFNKNNVDVAVTLLVQAVKTNPADVELQSNLGFMLIKANRANEAQQALIASLAIDPRRSSAWAPLAEVFDMQGKRSDSIAALLLTYEFSGNRDKTTNFFKDKAQTSDRESMRTAYAEALSKIQ